MLKLYRLRENTDQYFIGETKTNQVFIKAGDINKMMDAMIGFEVPQEFWISTPAFAADYFKWLKATLF